MRRACGSIGKTDAYIHCGLNRSERTIVQYGGLLCTSMTAHIFEHRPFTAIAVKVDMLVDEWFEHACPH